MDFDPSDVHETTKDICLGSLSPNDITSADDRTLTTNWDKEPIETAALPPLTDAVVFNAVETVERGVLSTDVGRNSIDGLLPELTAGKLRPSDGIVMKASPSNTVVEVKLSGFELPRLWFKMVWCTLITLHVVCGLYLICGAKVNFFLRSTKKLYLAGLATDSCLSILTQLGSLVEFSLLCI